MPRGMSPMPRGPTHAKPAPQANDVTRDGRVFRSIALNVPIGSESDYWRRSGWSVENPAGAAIGNPWTTGRYWPNSARWRITFPGNRR